MDVPVFIVLIAIGGQIVGGVLALLIYYAWSRLID